MSRTFLSNSTANYLKATGTAPAPYTQATFFAWVTDAGVADLDDRAVFGTLSGTKRQWFAFKGSQGWPGHHVDDNGDAINQSTALTKNVWRPAVVRVTDAGSGNFTWEVFLDGSVVVTRTLTAAALSGAAVQVVFGTSPTQSIPANSKVAHSAIWLRPLTNDEIANLSAGTNPSSIDATGRFLYYPMTDNSLVNAWADTPGSALAVNGTVPNDDADNPTVSAPVLPASVTTTDTLQPGESFTLTATNYASAPVSPATLTDSAGNSITVPVTISGSGPYTAVGTMPTLAEAVTAGTSLLFGDVTIELST